MWKPQKNRPLESAFACDSRDIAGGHMVLRTAPGQADVVLLRGSFRVAYPLSRKDQHGRQS
jgi:hypothetical protein